MQFSFGNRCGECIGLPILLNLSFDSFFQSTHFYFIALDDFTQFSEIIRIKILRDVRHLIYLIIINEIEVAHRIDHELTKYDEI